MGGRRKCKICGEWIQPEEEYVPYASGSVRGFAHKKCFDIEMKTLLSSKKEKTQKKVKAKAPVKQKELKEGLSDEEYKSKRELCDYIRSLIQEDLSPKIYTLIDYYVKKFNVTYDDIKNTLYWYYDLKGNPVEGDAIGIFPYQYHNAAAYFKQISSANEHNSQIKNVEELYRKRTIQISPTKPSLHPVINIEEIGEEAGET